MVGPGSYFIKRGDRDSGSDHRRIPGNGGDILETAKAVPYLERKEFHQREQIPSGKNCEQGQLLYLFGREKSDHRPGKWGCDALQETSFYNRKCERACAL